jgi:hypothetical protein
VLLKPTVQMARIKKAKMFEKKPFIKVLYALDVKIMLPIHCTAIGSLTATGRDCDSNRRLNKLLGGHAP